MKLVKTAIPKKKSVNFILLDGGVGDHMASLVAIDYVSKKYPWIEILLWTPDYLTEFAVHVLPNTKVGSFTSMKTDYNPDLTTKTTKWDGITSSMKIHLLDYAFLKLMDENPGIEYKNSLKINPDIIDVSMFNTTDKYVVVTTGFTAKARVFPSLEVNKLVSYIKDKGYTPVFVGQTKTNTGAKHIIEGNFDKDLNLSAGINLINKTSLLEVTKIMGNAAAVVGVDNGLLHAAAYTDTAIVGGFTSVSPEIRMPVRNNILGWNFYPVVPDKGCNFCQETTNFLYGHDYRECIYHDNPAVNEMTAKKFIEKLELIL